LVGRKIGRSIEGFHRSKPGPVFAGILIYDRFSKRFHMENNLMYKTGAISNDTWTEAGVVNVCKDLSFINRKNHHQTTRKGVPLVYRIALTLYQSKADGTGSTVVLGSDGYTVLKVQTVPNTWVHKNAAVKLHAGREAMFKNAGIKKSERGRYDKTIRYNWDEESSASAWLVPYDGYGDDFTGGSWETSIVAAQGDASITCAVLGTMGDEENTVSFTHLVLPVAYLSSRRQVLLDDQDTTDQPSAFSIMNALFLPVGSTAIDTLDNIRDISRDNQDNPPYDLDENGDCSEPIEAGRAHVGPGAGIQSTIYFDAPFGMFAVFGQHFDQGDANVTYGPAFSVRVLDTYPMAG